MNAIDKPRSSAEEAARTRALIAALETLLAAAKRRANEQLQHELTRGTVYAYTPGGEELGYANVPKASNPKPQVSIDDENRVLDWATELFGPGIATLRLTEQGRQSVIQFVLARHTEAGQPADYIFDGVTVRVPEPAAVTPRFTPAKNVVELVRAMAARGELNLTDILELEA